MTMELNPNLPNQISQAASIFDLAQRQYAKCSASHNINVADNMEQHKDIVDNAKQALEIYRACHALVKEQKSSVTISNRDPTDANEGEVKCNINLELRMAMILRFLAAVSISNTNNETDQRDDVSVQDNIASAIQYHDDAVSLLVGVFDDGEVDNDEILDTTVDLDDPQCVTKCLSKPNDEYDETNNNDNNSTTRWSFVTPTENQRVRAIASSLNSLALLHATINDDRCAMDSYREALEILRAATEEEKNEEGGERHVELDLAETLMNVGNFHLRRDELDAALNAFSTVYALHSGEEGSKDPSAVSLGLLSVNSPKSSDKASLTSYSTQALIALNNLGVVHERREELDKAYKCYNRVRLARTNTLGEYCVEVADSWINIGNCFQRQLDWKEAHMAYGKSVEIYRAELLKDDTSLEMIMKISRALSGALRNFGTCFWKQRKIADAIDQFTEAIKVEEEVITRMQGAGSMGAKDTIYQAKSSKAQILGILGCLYLESLDVKKFEKSQFAFQSGVDIYLELGYESNHPSIIWASNNLKAAIALKETPKQIPPPPPSVPPPAKRNPLSPSSVDRPEVVNREVSDQAAFDAPVRPQNFNRVISDKTDGDSVFLGVDDEQSSTDELDVILSEEIETIAKVAKEKKVRDDRTFRKESPLSPFDEETNFIKCANMNTNHDRKEVPDEVDLDLNDVPTSKHRNISYSSFTETPSDRNETSSREEELRDELSNHYERFGDESAEVAHGHLRLAEALWEKGDRVSATEHYTIAHSIFDYKLGDSKSCAVILKALGDLNKEDQIYDAAKELYEETMEIEIALYGHALPTTLNAAGTLCLLEDDHRAAMEYHRRALQIQQKSLDDGNKYDMYETLVLIGDVYYSERNNLSNIRTKGVDYQEFIEFGFLSWIANAHDMRGEYSKACQFYEESLQINISKKRKESKKETALTLNRLGSLNRELGRYEEAIDYHKRAMLLQQSHSNSAKAMTAETCVLMGMVKAKMGDYEKAMALYEDSLLVLKASLGNKHHSVAKTMSQIGSIHLELSNFDAAETILSEAEEYQLATAGEYHRDTFETQTLLGRLLSAIGKSDLALVKLHTVVENQMKTLGKNHPSVAETNSFIGECFLNQGMVVEAREMFVNCYNMRKIFFSLDQLIIAESMVDIIRARNGRPERSLAIYRNAMEIYREYLQDDHIQIGYLLLYEGDVHAELLDFATAVNCYHRANQIFYKAFGEGHLVEADTLVNIGKVLLRKCDYNSAKEQFCTALEIYSKKLPGGHPKIAGAKQHLDRVEQEEALCV